MGFYRRRPVRRSPEVIAAEKAAKDAHAMTCQCCARRIFAETGVIAHHGYERPGEGYQTASCFGARSLPWEVSRDRLGLMIANLKDQLAKLETRREQVRDDLISVPWTYRDKTVPSTRYNRYGDATVRVTVDSFPSDFIRYKEVCPYRQSPEPTYAYLKESYQAKLLRERDRLATWIAEAEKRFAGWVQTHERNDTGNPDHGVWIAL